MPDFRFFIKLCLLCLMLNYVQTAQAEPGKLRILSLSAAATHILTALEHPPTAIDQYGLIAVGDNPPPVLGRGSAVSLEKITELQINCVILWHYQRDAERLFRSRGLQVLQVQPLRLHTYPDLLTRLGKLTGKKERAVELCAKFKEDLKSLIDQQSTRRPIRVYFELYSEWKAVGNQSFPGDLLRVSGGLCPVEKTSLLSPEKILEFSPEVIFFIDGSADPRELARRPGLSRSSAARFKRIHAVDRRLITEGLAIIEAIDFFRQKLNEAR